MKNHILSEHALIVLNCDSCKQKCDSKEDLRKHVLKEHKNKLQKEVLLRKHNELVLKIINQRINIFEKLYELKQKEVKKNRKCNCRGSVCRINHFRFRWIASECDGLHEKLSNFMSTEKTGTVCDSEDKCLKCYKESDNEDRIEKPLQNSHTTCSSFPCKECDEAFLNEDDLQCHKDIVHVKTSEQSSEIFDCELCDAEFAGKEYLESHNIAYHVANNVFKCKQCDQMCSHKGELNAHIDQKHFKSLTKTRSTSSSLLKSFDSEYDDEMSDHADTDFSRHNLESTFFNPSAVKSK